MLIILKPITLSNKDYFDSYLIFLFPCKIVKTKINKKTLMHIIKYAAKIILHVLQAKSLISIGTV